MTTVFRNGRVETYIQRPAFARSKALVAEPVLHVFLRFAGYGAAVIGIVMSLPWIVQVWGLEFFLENGPAEILQLGLLAVILILLAEGYIRAVEWRPAFSVLMAFFAWAFSRENDSFFSSMGFFMDWKVMSVIGIAVCGALTYKARDRLGATLLGVVRTRGLVLVWAGFIVLGPLAQGLGHQPLLTLLYPGGYSFQGKHALEEILEFLGYLICLFGVIEILIEHLHTAHPRRQAATGPESAVPSTPSRAAASDAGGTAA